MVLKICAVAVCNCVIPLMTFPFIVTGWSFYSMFMFPQNKLVSIALTFLSVSLSLSLSFFYSRLPRPTSFCGASQLLCARSFSSISFTFNDMIIHISRLFQIITAFQPLFTLTSSPKCSFKFYVLRPFFLNFHISNSNNRKCFSSGTIYNDMSQGQGEKK